VQHLPTHRAEEQLGDASPARPADDEHVVRTGCIDQHGRGRAVNGAPGALDTRLEPCCLLDGVLDRLRGGTFEVAERDRGDHGAGDRRRRYLPRRDHVQGSLAESSLRDGEVERCSSFRRTVDTDHDRAHAHLLSRSG
jgi:hypothetical protein